MIRVPFKTLKIFPLFLIFILIWLHISCDGIKNPFLEKLDNKEHGNIPPETYFFIFFNTDTTYGQDTTWISDQAVITKDTVISSLDTTASRQKIYWWGEDQDGEVIGYYYQWSYMTEPAFTVAEAGTFYVPIRQKYDRFEFFVQAVDNDSMIDPSPARMSFPVYNSNPNIDFRLNSNPSAPAGHPNVTAVTFPHRTFIWDATDPDGNETIVAIHWALDDTSSWHVINKENNYLTDQVTITSDNCLVEGYHKFFVKAVDIAGAQSKTIMFPDSLDDEVPNRWYVQEARGSVLLVNDYAQDQSEYHVQSFYEDILQEVVADTYSVWEIGSTTNNLQNSLPYTSTDIEAYLGYFDKVIWFAHLGSPHISEAGLSITKYVKNGGKIFITNGNEEIPDTTWTFTNIDSVYRLNPGGRLLPGIDINAHFGDNEELNNALTLNNDQLIGNRVSALVAGNEEGVDDIYTMQHPDSTSVSVPYLGTPSVCVRYKPSYIEGMSIYFSLPLHYCNGYNNVKDLLDHILNVEFK